MVRSKSAEARRKKGRNKRRNGKAERDETDEPESPTSDPTSESPVRETASEEAPADAVEAVPALPPTPAARGISSWCNKFMATSRKDIVCEDSGLLETTPVNDYIIAGFSARCVEERPQSTAAECAAATADEKARNAAEGELSDSEAADEATAAALALQQREEATCALGDEEALRSAVAARVYVANLSYDSTEASIRARCALYGPITALSVPPSRDGRGGKLAGYAVVSYSKLADAEQAARRMDGARIDGRIVKARLEDLSRTASAKKRKHEGAGRYFGLETPAVRKKRNPCALCAGDGHLMESCPSQICTRCYLTGHSFRDCKSRREGSVASLCTACGAFGHFWKYCEADDGLKRLSAGARCVVCMQRGHLDCSDTPKPKTTDVFCCWCARAGHTEPSCPQRATHKQITQHGGNGYHGGQHR